MFMPHQFVLSLAYVEDVLVLMMITHDSNVRHCARRMYASESWDAVLLAAWKLGLEIECGHQQADTALWQAFPFTTPASIHCE